jgi:uncharacterized membrane protein YhaH (DUF805 family)
METNSIIQNFKEIVTNKYAQFTGRANKTEFWKYILVYIIVSVVLSMFINILGGVKLLRMLFMIIQGLFALALLIPSIAVGVRRMHDIGKGGGWILVNMIPLIGSIWFILLAIKDSEPGPNRFDK